MNELEKDILQTILNNELLLRTIKKVFMMAIEKEKPEIKHDDNNSLLGEKYRAYEVSRKIIENGFTDLLSYKVEKETKKSFDKAR